MQYVLTFLEGIITFISPCLLPMLPVYVSFFAGVDESENSKGKTLKNALGFVMGFTLVFVILGAFAGTVGQFLRRHETLINIVTGSIVILFGLGFLNIVKIPFLSRVKAKSAGTISRGFWSTVLFGMVFSIGWTPCVGTFLGSALMIAAQSGAALKGVILLLFFSLGLGIPFAVSAILIDKLKGAFDFIKKNYNVINIISGLFLVATGILMVTGYMFFFISKLTF